MVLFDIITDFVKDFSEEVLERIVPKIKSSKQTVASAILDFFYIQTLSNDVHFNGIVTACKHLAIMKNQLEKDKGLGAVFDFDIDMRRGGCSRARVWAVKF